MLTKYQSEYPSTPVTWSLKNLLNASVERIFGRHFLNNTRRKQPIVAKTNHEIPWDTSQWVEKLPEIGPGFDHISAWHWSFWSYIVGWVLIFGFASHISAWDWFMSEVFWTPVVWNFGGYWHQKLPPRPFRQSVWLWSSVDLFCQVEKNPSHAYRAADGNSHTFDAQRKPVLKTSNSPEKKIALPKRKQLLPICFRIPNFKPCSFYRKSFNHCSKSQP